MNKNRGKEILDRLIGPELCASFEDEIEQALNSKPFIAMSHDDTEILRIATSGETKLLIRERLPGEGYVEIPSNDPAARFFVLPLLNACGICGAPNTYAPAFNGPCIHCGAKFTYVSFKYKGEVISKASMQMPRVIHIIDD
jgi:hypothetical protein